MLGGSEVEAVVTPVGYQIEINDESAPVPSQQKFEFGTIVDWFPSSNFLPAGAGIIRGNGLRFTFTEHDVVSGDPSLVGHKVLFKGYKGYPGTATKVIVDPPEPSFIPEPQPQTELPQVVELPQSQPEPEQPLPLNSGIYGEELYGSVEYWADSMMSGFISCGGLRYKFTANDVIRGIPQRGAFAKFRAIAGDGDTPHAVDVELV